MYLFTRTTRVTRGATRDALAWASGITEKVNQITQLNVTLWTTMLSPAVGTLVWGCTAEDFTQLEVAQDKLNVDDMFMTEVDRGAQYTDGTLDDRIGQLLNPDPALAPGTPPPAYIAVVETVVGTGGYAKGVTVALQIAEKAKEIAGAHVTVTLDATGAYGGIRWISGYDSIAQLQRAEQALNADPGFVELVDREAVAAYLPGSATQTVFRRIA